MAPVVTAFEAGCEQVTALLSRSTRTTSGERSARARGRDAEGTPMSQGPGSCEREGVRSDGEGEREETNVKEEMKISSVSGRMH
jgi:hypothetical protein